MRNFIPTLVGSPVDVLLQKLDEQERIHQIPLMAICHRLSVFEGSFSIEAITAVLRDTDDVLGICALLRVSGAIIQEEAQPIRYTFDPDLRAVLLDQLSPADKIDAKSRFVAYYYELSVECASGLGRIPKTEILKRLDVERTNLIQAIEWAQGQTCITLVLNVWRWFYERGGKANHKTGKQIAIAGLRFHTDLLPYQRMELWRVKALFCQRLGDTVGARRYLEIAKGIACNLEDFVAVAQIRFDCATIAYACNELVTARQDYTISFQMACEYGDKWIQGCALIGLGMVAQVLEYLPEAEAHYRDAITLFLETGDARRQTRAQNNLATLCHKTGKLKTAEDLYRDCIRKFRRMDDMRSACNALMNLGMVLTDMQEWERAKRCLSECLSCSYENGYSLNTGLIVANIAMIACSQSKYKDAVRLFAAAHELEAANNPYSVNDDKDFVKSENLARSKVSAGYLTRYTDKGKRMTLRDILIEFPVSKMESKHA